MLKFKIFFFCFGCATQNKALDKIKLISIFFYQRLYSVNFKRIGNGPNSTTIATTAAKEIF